MIPTMMLTMHPVSFFWWFMRYATALLTRQWLFCGICFLASCLISYMTGCAPTSPLQGLPHDTTTARTVERTVLLEEFSNVDCAPCARQRAAFQQYVARDSAQVIVLQFHTPWPARQDPFFLSNPVVQQWRIGVYGVEQTGIPIVFVSGGRAPTHTLYSGAPADTAALSAEVRRLRAQKSSVSLRVRLSGGMVVVTAASQTALTDATLYIAVIERVVRFPSPVGSNGEREFFRVVRDVLPSTRGIPLRLEAQQQATFSQFVTFAPAWNQQQISVVAFVQDNTSNEVLQAATPISR